MEKLDVLNEKGEPTGEVKSYDKVHQDGDWHRAVHVWIINSSGELLIQKRSATKESHPNEWDISAAGHVLAGYSPIQSAIAECTEELGLVLSEKDFEHIFTYSGVSVQNDGTYFNNGINEVYLVRKYLDLAALKLQKEEVSEIKYIPWQELERKTNANDPAFVPHPNGYAELFLYLKK